MNIEWNIEQLAYRAMGKTEEQMEQAINNNEDIDEALYDKYEISFDNYIRIVKDLLPFTPVNVSAITNKRFHAFVDNEKSMAIVKLDVEQSASSISDAP